MVSTILVVGSTGNTGKQVMSTLPKLLQTSKTMQDWKVIGLTRSVNSDTAQQLAKLPHVEMLEKDWTMINAAWLREHNVARAFVASHNAQTAFTDESLLLTAMLSAGVQYVTRISTTPCNVAPATSVFYGRTHWAIENLLSQPEFAAMHWSSLQPNIFNSFALASAVQWVKDYRKDGTQQPLKTIMSGNVPNAPIEAGDVGMVAAHLLAQDDTAPHSGKRYKLNGPEDITGKQVVALVEKHAGAKVEHVEFENLDLVDNLEKQGVMASNVVASLKTAPVPSWEGKTTVKAMPTSKEVLELAPPRTTPVMAFEEMLQG